MATAPTVAELRSKLTGLNDLVINNNYFTVDSATLSVMRNKENLEGRLNLLLADHALVKQAAETYDRDFLDRTETGRTSVGGFWARRGVSTMQDWILLLFFMVYVAWLVVCVVYTLRYSTKKVFTVATILVLGPIFGIFLAAVIMRFG